MNTSGSKAPLYFPIGRHPASDRETPDNLTAQDGERPCQLEHSQKGYR